MNLIADESVDYEIIIQLRQMGLGVLSISEDSSGIKDSEVLRIAAKTEAYPLYFLNRFSFALSLGKFALSFFFALPMKSRPTGGSIF